MQQSTSISQAAPGLWRVMRAFWPYVQQQWSLLLVSGIALVAEVGLRVLEPWPLKIIFDYVLIPVKDTGITTPIDHLDPVMLLTVAALSIVGVTGLRAIASYWSTVSLAILGSRVMAQVRNRLYRHLQRLSLDYHSKARSGDLIVRVSSDASRLQEILLTAA
ncbi:MAG: ABC transporter transmembrane domain-containing protein, partial [Cyanobacteria bacterium P01_D01_bin.2]